MPLFIYLVRRHIYLFMSHVNTRTRLNRLNKATIAIASSERARLQEKGVGHATSVTARQ